MKRFGLFQKSDRTERYEVEYCFEKNYGGLDVMIRSDVDFHRDTYRILDKIYEDCMLGASNSWIEAKVLKALKWNREVKSCRVNVEGRKCEIWLSSDPRAFVGS